ncbi:MAG TPA: TetR/AcrR family transcriptional regulator [Steroidobacteraceae bacterium]|nr:TetR/AcrR family transcriptional regulator [Steroidobacteraceae bacterium]
MSEQAAVYEHLSARARLLAAANELFYEEGLNTVGIDRIIERAGVAKASLYNTFGSKDALVHAYLVGRHEARRARIIARIEALPSARARILGIFDEMEQRASEPGFKGCAFVRASAETREGSCVKAVCEETRAWLLDLLRSLAKDSGASDPEALARQLMVLYDGAAVAGQMDGDANATRMARAVAEQLVPG